MPLEDLTGDKYVDSLVPSNPVSGDDRYEGDNHLRGVKNVLKKTFPALTGPVGATQTELNALEGYAGDDSVDTRLNAAEAHAGTGNIHFEDAQANGVSYIRQNNGWVPATGAGITTLDVITTGADPAEPDRVDLDYQVYYDGASNIIENDRLSFVVIGSTPGHHIKVKIGGTLQANAIAKVGKNGQAHGWLTAETIEDAMGWSGSAYSLDAAIIFVDDDGAGGLIDITPTKTALVTKTTIDASGGAVTEQVIFGWNGQALLALDVNDIQTTIGYRHIGWEVCPFQVINSTPSATVEVSIGGLVTYSVGSTNAQGNFIGEVSGANILDYAGSGIGNSEVISILVGGVVKGTKSMYADAHYYTAQ